MGLGVFKLAKSHVSTLGSPVDVSRAQGGGAAVGKGWSNGGSLPPFGEQMLCAALPLLALNPKP